MFFDNAPRYWNVGHGVILPMYLFTALAITACCYGFYRRLQVYRQGKPLNRLDHLSGRIAHLLENLFGQIKVVRVKGGGIPHAFFFWGFVSLFIGTLLIMAQADFSDPLFHIQFLKGDFYKLYSLVLDLAGFIALVTLFGL